MNFKKLSFCSVFLILLFSSLCGIEASEKKPQVLIHKLSSEELAIQPALTSLDPGHTKYLFEYENFPNQTEVIFYLKRVYTDKFEEKCRFFVNNDSVHNGVAARRDYLSTRGFLPGEKIVCRFETEDNECLAETSFTPIPLVVQKGGVALEAELGIFSMYTIHLSGLSEGDEYTTRSISGDEIIENKLTFTNRRYHQVMPAVMGARGGISRYQVKLKSKEVLELKLPWGEELTSYLKGEKLLDL